MTLYGIAGAKALPILADSLLRSDGQQHRATAHAADDPLSRNVYGVLGVPIDATSLPEVLVQLKQAAEARKPFLLSTPNLNFLVLSQSDASFRESLLLSDLCPADGIAIVWLGRILGVPLSARIAGSDIFDAIRLDHASKKPMKVFLFGGADGLAKSVAGKINSASAGMRCVGAICPGFGSVEKISASEFFEEINASEADFIAAFLGAKKGQEWLLRNHHRISVPIRAHLGATINYQAGTVRRAPRFFQYWGLEWLWRIKEEPYLWQRYVRDGLVLIRIVLASVLPLAVYEFARRGTNDAIELSHREEGGWVKVSVRGAAVAENIEYISACFRAVISLKKSVLLDVSNATRIDPRMLGLLIVIRKLQRQEGLEFGLVCRNRVLRRIIGLRGFGYLLTDKA